jgi:hypothetical protein
LKVAIGFHHHITTPTPITTGWSTGGYIFFPSKGRNTVAASTGFHGNHGLVDELQNYKVNPPLKLDIPPCPFG